MGDKVMKLYVWEEPYDVSYGSTLAFAVADSVEAAREQLRAARVYGLTGPPTHIKLGEPTRILELPCGEWHEWAE